MCFLGVGMGQCGEVMATDADRALPCAQGFFGSLRLEMADRGIKVTMVCPGPVLTEGQANAASAVAGQVVGKVLHVCACSDALPSRCLRVVSCAG